MATNAHGAGPDRADPDRASPDTASPDPASADCTITIGDDPQGDLSAIPASHGVLCFVSGGLPVQVIASADMRSAALARLCERPADAPPQQDSLRGVCDRVLVWRAGSAFEADLRFLDVARERLPDVHRQAVSRLIVWWLAIDPDRPGEGWQITDLVEGVPAGCVIGPFLDRSSARRWSEMLDAQFELCRYPAELRRSPRGTPCAYKEMGRCPAACDGSEPMGSYLGRLCEALALTSEGIRARCASIEAEMAAAAQAADFERATRLRDRLDDWQSPDAPATMAVGPLGRFSLVAVTRTRSRGLVRLIVANAGGWRVVGDVDASAVSKDELHARLSIEPAFDGPDTGVIDTGMMDTGVMGVVARSMIRPKRGGPELLRSDATPDELLSAVRRVGRIGADGANDDD